MFVRRARRRQTIKNQELIVLKGVGGVFTKRTIE